MPKEVIIWKTALKSAAALTTAVCAVGVWSTVATSTPANSRAASRRLAAEGSADRASRRRVRTRFVAFSESMSRMETSTLERRSDVDASQLADARLEADGDVASRIDSEMLDMLDGGGTPLAPDEADQFATIDDDRRFEPTARPHLPEPQTPPISTPENSDVEKPFLEWQRATGDWMGVRPTLDDHGIVFQASFTADFAKNLHGGLNTNGSDFRHLLNVNFTLDTAKLLGLEGGTAFISFQNQNGPGANDPGDAQGTSNIDADGRTQVSEIWYSQSLLDKKLRVKLGKIDANTDFAAPANAAEFINSSMGYSPTILGLPTYPDPAFGIDAFVEPTEHTYLGGGVFDGAGQRGIETGSRGPATLFGSPSDLFLIGEAGLKWTAAERRDGRFAMGVWRHTGRFERLNGGTDSATWGLYLVADQSLWRENPDKENDEQGVAAYFQYGYANPAVSPFHHHLGVGLTWTGPIEGRDDDILGLGVTYVQFAKEADFLHDGELTIETFYKAQITPWFSLKPDLQYVHNPGDARNDALVATFRAVVDF